MDAKTWLYQIHAITGSKKKKTVFNQLTKFNVSTKEELIHLRSQIVCNKAREMQHSTRMVTET